MGEANANMAMYLRLSNETQFRLNRINEIKYYFIAEIREKEIMSTGLTKYIAAFDYLDKAIIFLSARSVGDSIPSLLLSLVHQLE